MATDKLINHSQGESIITNLGTIATNLQNVTAISPAKFGMGYAVCDTAAGTAAKTANIANYVLTEGALVTVKFTNANTASNATLNLNNTGAKPILYKGSALTTDIISAGDICTFIYSTANSGSYNIINVDALSGAGAGTVKSVGAEGGLTTDQTSGAAISTTGNVKLNLKSDTAYTGTVSDPATTDKVYPVSLDSTGHPCVGVPWTDTTYTQASNSAITVDNTNHTIDVAAGTTSVAGVVQLEDSYSSTSATTAATPNAVKAAYDLANGKYAKPNDGIPATDLASAVQTSLTAADNAVPNTRTINGTALSSDITLTAADVGAIATTAKGANSGVAELDANGKVPAAQLPSYVDDVLEYSAKSSFPATGETGKIYIDTSDNKTYRWSGSLYVEISESLALGVTSSTAYYGDKGKTAYDHATESGRLTTATASGLYKVASTAQGHIASLTPVEKSDITGLGIPGTDTNTHRAINVNGTQLLGDNTTALNIASGSNVTLTPDTSTGKVTIAATDTTYSNATTTAAGLMSADDKTKLNGIDSGAQVNSITGVKGNAESTYRTGNVNITSANIGLGNVGNFKAVSTVASQGLTDTEKSNARANIGAGTSSLTLGTSSTQAAAGNHTHNYAGSSSAGGPALSVLTNGQDVQIGTASPSSDDSGDLVFLYGNGSEKMRIWTDNAYTSKSGPNIRMFNASGTQLYTGKLPLADGTGLPAATTSAAGLMSAADKSIVNSLSSITWEYPTEYNSDVFLVEGGFVIIGKLCIINMEFKTGAAVPPTILFTDLPSPAIGTVYFTIVTTSNSASSIIKRAEIYYNGDMASVNPIEAGLHCFINLVYVMS